MSEGKAKDDIKDFEQEVWTYFGMGVNLQELYLSPDLMTSAAWDIVALAAKWSRRNMPTFQDSHWVGGDPLEHKMGVVYGFGSFGAEQNRVIVTLRNPGMKMAAHNFNMVVDFELPAEYTQKQWVFRSVYGPSLSACFPNVRPQHDLTQWSC